MTFTAAKLLVLLAFVCFLLATFSVALPIALVPLGLAFLAASMLVP